MSKKPIVPGLYFFHNHAHIDGGVQHTGSQLTLTWAQVEPYKNKCSTVIDDWVAVERGMGRPWILRVDVHQNRGARSLPGWVPRLTFKLKDGRPVDVPDYRSKDLQRHLCEFVKMLGERYDQADDLSMVQIGLGLYGETHPERDDAEGALASAYRNVLTGCEWMDYCKRVMDAYAAAFPRTELCIMNAPTYNQPCRGGVDVLFKQTWARDVVDDYALSLGIGAQNNSLDEWDANWYTANVVGSNGPYTVRGCVGPFVEAGRMVAFERGAWLAPFGALSKSWWAYLNGLSKGARILFPPNWAGKFTYNGTAVEFPSGVWNYSGPWADELRWMNDFALRSLRGEIRWWAAFDAPHDGTYWYGTAQHFDHEVGVKRISPMASEWKIGEAAPPFYESRYMRRLLDPVTFETAPGRYRVTLWYRGVVRGFGSSFVAYDWKRDTFDADVPARFSLEGDGYVHMILLEPVPAGGDQPPIEPPAYDSERFEFTLQDGRKGVLTIG